jgi:hypothetical protein
MFSSKQCTECRPILGSLAMPHMMDACPLQKLRYCGICATYGHNQHNCPDQGVMMYRQPLYVEQLIPASLAIEHSITSKTPLPLRPVVKVVTPPIMEVPETEEAIRAALVAAGEKPMICQQKGRAEKKEMIENKKRLQKIADIYGRRLIYVADPSKVLSSPTPVRPKKK